MISTRHLTTLHVTIGPILDIGPVPGGHRRVVPITGGHFTGKRMNGVILPGGADWNIVRPDGTVYIWARYTLQTDDGTLIMITNDGLQPGTPEAMARIFAGEPHDPTTWYSRTRPVFEVSGEKDAFLNSRVFVGDLTPKGREAVAIEVSEVL